MLSPFICINPHLHIQRETPATPLGMPAWAHNRPVKKLGVVCTDIYRFDLQIDPGIDPRADLGVS